MTTQVPPAFIIDALNYQSIIEDDQADSTAKAAAARSLHDAAAKYGLDRIATAANRLHNLHQQPDPSDDSVIHQYQVELAASLIAMFEPEPQTQTAADVDDEPTVLRMPGDEATRVRPREAPTFGSDVDMEPLRDVFRDEASSVLESIARVLTDADRDADIDGIVEALLRAAHSLKGSAATVGMTEVAGAAHLFEEHVSDLRRSLNLSRDAQKLLRCLDLFRDIVFAPPSDVARASGLFKSTLEALGEAAEDTRTSQVSLADLRRRSRRPSTITPLDHPILRIDARHLDRLLDDLGALVLDQSRLDRRVALLSRRCEELTRLLPQLGIEDKGEDAHVGAEITATASELSLQVAGLASDLGALADATNDLRRGMTELRMDSVSALFERLTPKLRAAAREQHKRVQFHLEGGETRFDRSVADTINESLVHLMRNAIAHGIETPQARSESGKSDIGNIVLRAQQRADTLILEVADDGSGIDVDELRARLVATKKWSASRAKLANDEEVLASIFDAGMSSRDLADELAGRGIGLDAVRAGVSRLGGEVEVSSTPGTGTTFRVRLPVSTTVIQATMLHIGDERCAIPSPHALEVRQVDAQEIVLGRTADGIPLFNGHELFALTATRSTTTAAILGSDDRRIAISCDSIGSYSEIVVKSLGPILQQVPMCNGATITGSGRVVFILDPIALATRAHGEQAQRDRLLSSTTTAAPVPPRVLVVDDSRTTRQSIANILDQNGYVVDLAEDAERALVRLETIQYDALVTDIEMPGVSGIDLVEQLRARPQHQELAIVIITGTPTADYRERAARARVAGLLPKPVAGSDLVALLRSALD